MADHNVGKPSQKKVVDAEANQTALHHHMAGFNLPVGEIINTFLSLAKLASRTCPFLSLTSLGIYPGKISSRRPLWMDIAPLWFLYYYNDSTIFKVALSARPEPACLLVLTLVIRSRELR